MRSSCSSGSTASESPSASGGGESSAPAASCTVKIATELPMQGSELAASQPIINGVKLALKQAGGKAGDCTVDADLAPALKRAIAVVKKGEPALVDVVTQVR